MSSHVLLQESYPLPGCIVQHLCERYQSVDLLDLNSFSFIYHQQLATQVNISLQDDLLGPCLS